MFSRPFSLLLLALAFNFFCVPVQGQSTNENPTSGTAQKTAVFAGGCFWGTEYLFQDVEGVISTEVGYSGGYVQHPTYRQVSSGKTGHAESVEITYDPRKVTYEQLARRFFEIHDPTQLNRQGPDVGTQYRSTIFYGNETERSIAQKLIAQLKAKNINVVTTLEPASTFWPAEKYHQRYYAKNGKKPYCHKYKKLF